MTQPRHKWGDAVAKLPAETANGCEQTERVCAHCGLIKITVHPPVGFPWREWRLPGSRVQVKDIRTPACTVAAAVESAT